MNGDPWNLANSTLSLPVGQQRRIETEFLLNEIGPRSPLQTLKNGTGDGPVAISDSQRTVDCRLTFYHSFKITVHFPFH